MEKITEIATNIQNGNLSIAQQQIEVLKPIEVLNLVEEYNLLTGLPFNDCIRRIKGLSKD